MKNKLMYKIADVDKSDQNHESDSNLKFNLILIFYIESKINFRHEMSTL